MTAWVVEIAWAVVGVTALAAAIALWARGRTLDAMARRLAGLIREIEQLNELGDALRACTTMDEVAAVMRGPAAQLVPGDRVTLYLTAASRGLVDAADAWGTSSAAEWPGLGPEECWALKRSRPHLVVDTRSGLCCRHVPSPPPASYLCAPLGSPGNPLGVLHIATPGGAEPAEWTEVKHRRVIMMGERLSLALGTLGLEAMLVSQSIRDALTGLFNRGYMEAALEQALERARRGREPLGVIMMDIDHFKRLNDTQGHDAGDALLRAIGALLRTEIRRGDVPCRYGGEEFVLILPGLGLDDAERRAEELRLAIRRLEVAHAGRALGPVTVSLGVAAYPEHGATSQALLRAADVALYGAKAQGRDRVVCAG
ncbi:MAG TPA: sensor domain-containing diguanylate cyclase [Methylomirabilota bacterium]|nr:sensor domain-containing diguanylate cyclase [Methylomirabilota bacterium]